MLIEEFLNHASKARASTTLYTYSIELSLFERWLAEAGTDLSNYARMDVQTYLDTLVLQKKAASTINKSWSAIKAFSRWVGNLDAIEDIRVPKPANLKLTAPKSLSKLERNKMLREVDRNENSRNKAIIILLLNTGIRISELVSLDKADVELFERKGQIRVIGKNYKERVIPLNSETRRALKIYLNERDDNEPALFISNYKKRMAKRSAQRVVEKYGHHAHQLRHTVVRQLVVNNVDMSTIKSITGHESADMIMRYSAPTEEEKANALDSMYLDNKN